MNKPLVVHRYSFTLEEAAEALLGDGAGDAAAWQVRIEDGVLVVDIVDPWRNTETIEVPAAGIDMDKLSHLIETGALAIVLPETPPLQPPSLDPIDEPDQQQDDMPADELPEDEELSEAPPQGEQEPAGEEPERKGGALANKAGYMCSQRAFHLFVEVGNEEEAKLFIYEKCGVKSRVDLDYDEEAGEKFRQLATDYEYWLQAVD